MSAEPIEIRPVAGAIGAEISGVDLARELAAETIAAIRCALLDHLVVFFRGQELTPARFLAFARRFGEPIEYPFVRGLDGFPMITPVVKLEHETVNFGGVWHADTTYLAEPPMATMLFAREVPPYGGDTLFANMYLAYETLSPGLRRMLDGLVGVSDSAKADGSKTREDRVRDHPAADAAKRLVAEHPAVRTHPETGRRALYVNGAHTAHFRDMTIAESAPLLAYLFRHQQQPEFTCRFRWEKGSLAFWDNRAAQHNAVNDYHGHRRVMQRITLKGDTPR
ncbi:MAG TPA: TauD/TfdA family dioxygenase [Stellaceae bacterium]|jgi:taurine dioxygenase|nr:TauD/TfdA family dioxygenase [Stellaceae bacterium]